MSKAQTEKTLGDYLVIAICPLLIMALVGTTAFFLLELGYQGQWLGRLRWTLCWFVLAAVLISRISIQQGSIYANVYGVALALATGAQIYRLVGVTYVGWGLLAFIWWCASKLTWDCTLVDDEEDASGAGLLQVAGLEKSAAGAAEKPKPKPRKKLSWWPRWDGRKPERSGKPHAPGSWVIYFSLLALPAFGLGQAFFSAEDYARREFAFRLLGIYVAAALGLLLATSFLGLRRYLRQRGLPMPVSMAGLWIFLGSVLAGAIMIVCLVLPRPDGVDTFSTLVNYAATELAVQASKYAVLGGNSGDGEGRQIGAGDGNAQEMSDEQKDGNGQRPGQQGASNEQAGRNKAPGQADQKGSTSKSGAKKNSGGKGQQNPKLDPLGKTADAESRLADIIKWLIYGLVAGAIGYLLYRYRREVARLLRELWAALKEVFALLFGWFRKQPVGADKLLASATPTRKFAGIPNPFMSGAAAQMTPEELVNYTFDALEVWAAERNWGRLPDVTPLEFARRLGAEMPEIANDARVVARLVTRMAYAEFHPTRDHLAELESLWESLEAAEWKVAADAQSAAPIVVN